MAHELDFSTGEAAIAYRGELPWHGLGYQITEDMSLDDMREAARLNWSVERAPIEYHFQNEIKTMANRSVLYRSDTGEALSVMSENKYHIRQPAEIVEFFRDLCDYGGFEIETLGALHGGAKVWALAKRKDVVDDIKGDIIKPYIMLADSYDGTLATVARFTTVRVVCQNTLNMSERDKATQVKVNHSVKFDADKVKTQLGRIDESFAEYMETMRNLAKVKMSEKTRERFFRKLFAPKSLLDETGDSWLNCKIDDEKVSTAAKNTVAELMRLAGDGNAAGNQFAPNTDYNALQTVTYFLDHKARSKGGLHWQSANFGPNASKKELALELLTDKLAA